MWAVNWNQIKTISFEDTTRNGQNFTRLVDSGYWVACHVSCHLLHVINYYPEISVKNIWLYFVTANNFQAICFYFNSKESTHKKEAESFVRQGHSKGKIIYFYPVTSTVLTVTVQPMINGNFICAKKLLRNFRSEKNLKES